MALDTNVAIPAHVALILDGNGRWAKKRGLPRTLGHKEGCVTVEKTVEIAARLGIRYLTVYGFSTKPPSSHTNSSSTACVRPASWCPASKSPYLFYFPAA